MNNIIIAGVGGQGTLLAGSILGQLAVIENRDVKISEVHGMAQRGGSVVTYVRIGDINEKVYSPLIDKGKADNLIAFELLEALRWQSYLKTETGKAYINTQKILPMPVIVGACEYPENIEYKIKQNFPHSKFINALELAKEAGSQKTINTILLGLVSNGMDFKLNNWEKAIENTVKPKYININKVAFHLGRSASL